MTVHRATPTPSPSADAAARLAAIGGAVAVILACVALSFRLFTA